MAIDWSNPVETDEENPRQVRVLCTDLDSGTWPVAVAVMNSGAQFNVYSASKCGLVLGKGEEDGTRLRNVIPRPIKREGWMYVGKTDAAIRMNTYVYASEDIARERHPGGCPGYKLIRIEWEEVP